MLRTRKEEKVRKSKEWSENATCRRLILTRLSKKEKEKWEMENASRAIKKDWPDIRGKNYFCNVGESYVGLMIIFCVLHNKRTQR